MVTPSIGIAVYPKDGADIEDLLVKADMAMYKAKDQGRNGHAFYGESMAIRSLSRLELENDLRRAFDAGDFQIHHQPKVDLATGRVVGVEALLRWQHAVRGWISPEVFIPVAEECGLIIALGDLGVARNLSSAATLGRHRSGSDGDRDQRLRPAVRSARISWNRC